MVKIKPNLPCVIFHPNALILFCILVNLNKQLFVSSVEFHYGQHFPNGISAVNYIYGSNGTWKSFTPLNYVWNYYEQHATLDHPFDKGALIQAANGSAFYTARDANGYLLCDSDYDFEINPEYCPEGNSLAFHEHNGIKAQGIRSGDPFTQFWFDDNWLASHMSEAYNRSKPKGLIEQDGFLRWRVINGDVKNWSPYGWNFFDTLALDGLYYLSQGDFFTALKQWNNSLILSEARWNDTEMNFEYPGLHENYHVGLWKVLTEMLMEHPGIPFEINQLLLQHSVSLRLVILRNQEIDKLTGDYLGWVSNIGSDSALINTESVSCCVLGLGANAKYVFEAIKINNKHEIENFQNFAVFMDNHNRITSGPGFPIPPGNYTTEFLLRAKRYDFTKNESRLNLGEVKIVDVTNIETSTKYQYLKQSNGISYKKFTSSDFGDKIDHWIKIKLDWEAQLSYPSDSYRMYDFVVMWNSDSGDGEIELSAVSVK